MKRHILGTALLACALGAASAQGLANLDAVPGLQPGSVLVLTIGAGASSGQVWGTDIYTTDSNLGAAAVHAGVLADRTTGTVIVEVLPGMQSYEGSSRNGVTSAKWGSFGKSFRFLKSLSGQAAMPAKTTVQRIYAFDDESALVRIKPVPGAVAYFRLTGSASGRIWGTGTYTIDSSPGMAAVHAGVLGTGQSGVVKVTILPGLGSYEGSSRNGVSSLSYGAYGASYTIEPAPAGAQVGSLIADPGTVARLPGAAAGQSYVIWVAGQAGGGSIWGSGQYTSDSSLATAVVHAGLIPDGGAGPVIVRVLPGRASYEGSARNGVTSSAFGAYGLSYTLEAAR